MTTRELTINLLGSTEDDQLTSEKLNKLLEDWALLHDVDITLQRIEISRPKSLPGEEAEGFPPQTEDEWDEYHSSSFHEIPKRRSVNETPEEDG